MAAQPPKAGEQPPPDLPYIAGMSDTLANYLRTFSLWCRNGFRDKMPLREASPQLLLLSPGGLTFSVGVGDDGKLTSTPIAFSTGAPGTPVLTFAPVTVSSTRTGAAPAGTTSTTFVMMGLGLTSAREADIEPRISTSVATRAWTTVNGTISNTTNNGQSIVQLYYGIGTPPANGAAATGTAVGLPQTFQAASGGSLSPFSLTGLITGLTPGTSYWFDLALRVSAGTGAVSNVVASYFGLP